MKRAVWLAVSTLIFVVLVAGFIVPPQPLLQLISSTPSPLPMPTPAPRTKSDSIGICVHSLPEKDAQLVSQSGAQWIRIDCNSSDSKFGDYLRNAKAYNLSVLAILDGWMFSGNTDFTLEDWNKSVTRYVAQYANEVDAWEIWNEPANPKLNWTLLNLTISGPDGVIQENLARVVDFYYNMTATAHEIIKQYDPNATIVLFGGLNLYSGGDPNLTLDEEFARQLEAKDVLQFGDAIAVHAYPWGNRPSSDWESQYNASLEYYRGLFTNSSVEIWVTETGQNITDLGGSVQLQAQYLNECLDFFSGRVSRVFWYILHDDPPMNDFGLIDASNSPREAYNELYNRLSGEIVLL